VEGKGYRTWQRNASVVVVVVLVMVDGRRDAKASFVAAIQMQNRTKL
jgi:hypothetical protein